MRGTLFPFRSPSQPSAEPISRSPAGPVVTPFLPPPAPRMAGRSRAGWEPQGRKEPGVGEFGDRAETGLFCLPHKPSWASAAPSGAFRLWNCSQNDRPVAPSWVRGWGWGEGGEPQARGSWRVKNSSSRVSVSKCGGGELEAGRWQAVFAHSAGLFPLGPRSESPWSC